MAVSALNPDAVARQPLPAVVDSVEPGSIGEDLGFEPGDQLLSINGIRPRDLIDYRYLCVEEDLHLEVRDAAGVLHQVDLEKDADDGLGLAFTEALFDGLRQCNNHCPFCFIDQQPPGHRDSLYLKDDDFRLSFLYGSYLTLTNLTDADWQRIDEQRLSPLYVSVHATEPELRERLLVNPRAGLLMQQLAWFAERDLQIHAQVVVCPGINDGAALDRSLQDLASFAGGDWPAVLSAAVVPVGLTRFRPPDDGLRPVDPACARTVIAQVEAWQKQFQARLGSRFAWLSDEWYLMAEASPAAAAGVRRPSPAGKRRRHHSGFSGVLGSGHPGSAPTGPRTAPLQLGGGEDRGLGIEVGLRTVSIALRGLSSSCWACPVPIGGRIRWSPVCSRETTCLSGLAGLDLGDELLLPSVMLRQGQPVFLDDMSLEELRAQLPVPVRIVHGAADIVASVLGGLGKSP